MTQKSGTFNFHFRFAAKRFKSVSVFVLTRISHHIREISTVGRVAPCAPEFPESARPRAQQRQTDKKVCNFIGSFRELRCCARGRALSEFISRTRRARSDAPYLGVLTFAAILLGAFSLTAAVLPPEQLLPKETVLVITAPDCAQTRSLIADTPSARLLHDPALEPFREGFAAKFTTNIIQPLERELGIHFSDFEGIAQGQFTFALVPEKTETGTNRFAKILLLDARGQSNILSTNLAILKKKWADSGTTLKTNRVREIDFTTVSTSTDELGNVWKKAFPNFKIPEPEKPIGTQKFDLSVGQLDSLLIAADSLSIIGSVIARQGGDPMAALDKNNLFHKDYAEQLNGAAIYAWAEVKPLLERLRDSESSTNASEFQLGKTLSALGFAEVKSISITWRNTPEGSSTRIFARTPESNRRGLFKALEFQSKDSSPPSFIPSSALKFSRWRLNLPQSWTALENAFSQINPTFSGLVSYALQIAGKDKDEKYDLKPELLSSLGDDIISFHFQAGTNSVAENSSILLIGSPSPEKLAKALTIGMLTLGPGSPITSEQEIPGHRVTTVTMGQDTNALITTHLTAMKGYVALSGDFAGLQSFIQQAATKTNAPPEKQALCDAAQKIGGTTNGLFGFENQKEILRACLSPQSTNKAGFGNILEALTPIGMVTSPEDIQMLNTWGESSSIPSFDVVSTYLYFSIYTGSVDSNGFNATFFAPAIPKMPSTVPQPMQ